MRLKCPRCSMVVEGTPGAQVVCSSCGFTAIAPGAPAAPAPAPPPADWQQGMMSRPMAGAPPAVLNPNHGPLGKRRGPWAVVLLNVVTLGIYFLVWAWTTSREVDAFMQRPGQSHRKMKAGIILVLVGIVMAVAGVAVFLSSPASVLLVDPEAEPDVDPGIVLAATLLLFVGLILLVVGWVLRIVAFWKLWKMMEEEDVRRLQTKPFSPILALLLVILGIIIPWVGWAVAQAAYYLTQDGLNKTWEAYGPQLPRPVGY